MRVVTRTGDRHHTGAPPASPRGAGRERRFPFVNRRNATAPRLLFAAAIAALSVFLLFCGPLADCCPLAITVSAPTEPACCLDSDQTASTTVTTATAGAIRDRAISGWRAPGIEDEDGVSSAGRSVDPVPVLTLPPTRAVLTVRLRI